jgi:hypothetical protein
LQTTELIDQIYFSSGDSQASGLAELVAFFRYSTRAHAPVAEVEFVALEGDGERTPGDGAEVNLVIDRLFGADGGASRSNTVWWTLSISSV